MHVCRFELMLSSLSLSLSLSLYIYIYVCIDEFMNSSIHTWNCATANTLDWCAPKKHCTWCSLPCRTTACCKNHRVFLTMANLPFGRWFPCLHSGKLTCQWKMDPLKMYFLLNMEIFHCYVVYHKVVFFSVLFSGKRWSERTSKKLGCKLI